VDTYFGTPESHWLEARAGIQALHLSEPKRRTSLQLATEGDIQIAFRTAFRSAGRTACSNHGCFRIQIRLLQLGCGSGKN
jgi:hypothetical protein